MAYHKLDDKKEHIVNKCKIRHIVNLRDIANMMKHISDEFSISTPKDIPFAIKIIEDCKICPREFHLHNIKKQMFCSEVKFDYKTLTIIIIVRDRCCEDFLYKNDRQYYNDGYKIIDEYKFKTVLFKQPFTIKLDSNNLRNPYCVITREFVNTYKCKKSRTVYWNGTDYLFNSYMNKMTYFLRRIVHRIIYHPKK